MTATEIVGYASQRDLVLISIGSHRSYDKVRQLCDIASMFCWDNHKNYHLIPASILAQVLLVKGVSKARVNGQHYTMCWNVAKQRTN